MLSKQQIGGLRRAARLRLEDPNYYARIQANRTAPRYFEVLMEADPKKLKQISSKGGKTPGGGYKK